MSVSNPQKTVHPTSISCGGTAAVTISFDVEAELQNQPTAMVLIMDRSGSMYGPTLVKAQIAARGLVQTISKASGDPQGQTIAGGSALGLISFNAFAVEEVPLGTSVPRLNQAIDSLTAAGKTNHENAFLLAQQMLNASVLDRKIAILFTDGESNIGNADPVAAQMKAQGMEIYCIGLVQDPAPLNRWASDPVRDHVAVTDDPDQLERVFDEIAAQISKTELQEVSLLETLNPEFRIDRVHPGYPGTVTVTDLHSFHWDLGTVSTSGRVSLTFDIMHTGSVGGSLEVNRSLLYSDRSGNVLSFPSPILQVDCGGPVIVVDPCPISSLITAEHCADAAEGTAGNIVLSGLGRIIKASAVLKHVCPGKRVAVAAILTERDQNGVEYARGMKTLLVPAQEGRECQDILLKCIQFIVPEALDTAGEPGSICNERHFQIRIAANYVDTDFTCCDAGTAIL